MTLLVYKEGLIRQKGREFSILHGREPVTGPIVYDREHDLLYVDSPGCLTEVGHDDYLEIEGTEIQAKMRRYVM